ncbi:hypothetical protein LWI29_000241 [Acer saccharum]|uniref:Uncharacterized protein n=1 Tax=Acer saccharum TaxID=4024 RepID=A0AA39T036_ACESA|nr:hypothetical protein LWI29_000241 [Acer saccharum]
MIYKTTKKLHSGTARHHHSPPPISHLLTSILSYRSSPSTAAGAALIHVSSRFKDYGGRDWCHGSIIRVAQFYYS